jgi:hypothetical protein
MQRRTFEKAGQRAMTKWFIKNIALKTTIILSILIVLLACNDAEKTAHSTKLDSSKINRDTAGDHELKNLVKEYESLYSNPVQIDTSFERGIDTFRLLFRHFSTMDSSIALPKKYVEMYGLQTFITHDFESTVELHKNGRELLKRKIKKEDFKQRLDSILQKYATLLYPNVNIISDTIFVDYSVSIPLTDVGKGMKVTLTKDGKMEVSDL